MASKGSKKQEPKREFVTSSGQTIHLRPVAERSLREAESDVEREFEEAKKPVAPPQYAVPLAGGEEELFYHDDKSIKTATDEEKVAWGEHLACLVELREEQNERKLAVSIVEGVEDEPDEAFLKYLAWRKSEVPDNPYDLKVRFVTYMLLRTPEDILEFSAITTLLSHGLEVDEAAIDAALESFRDSIRGQAGPFFEKLTETLARGAGGDLDVQPAVPEGAGGAKPGEGDDGVRPDEQERQG